MIWTYRLFFSAPVHFGLEGIGQERIENLVRSDTLWGALVQKILLLYEIAPETLCTNPPFSLSSCFPVIGDQRFFPVPSGSLDAVMNQVARLDYGQVPFDLKELKKIRFIAEPLFNKVLSGEALALSDLAEGTVYPLSEQPDGESCPETQFYAARQRPRVTVDQIYGGVRSGNFFYCTDQFFDDQAGMFFLASFENEQAQECFDAALRLLGDSGLGADRSIGRGSFTYSSEPFEVKELSTNPEAHVLLSLYHPSRQEVEQGILTDDRSAYSLTRRSGHAGSHHTSRFRRSDLWMLTEGSLLPFAPEGGIPVVLKRSERIPHDVYRYGRAFCLPVYRRLGA